MNRRHQLNPDGPSRWATLLMLLTVATTVAVVLYLGWKR